jgi:hypothetical protein
VVTGQVSDRLDLAWTYDVVRQDLPLAPSVSWYGGAAYARYRLSETMAISTRFEKFRDPTGSISGTGQVLRGRTVTLEHRASSEVLLKLEWRRDTSSASVFRIEDFPLGTSRYTGEQDLLTVGLVATF